MLNGIPHRRLTHHLQSEIERLNFYSSFVLMLPIDYFESRLVVKVGKVQRGLLPRGRRDGWRVVGVILLAIFAGEVL